jgi:uncharacterized FlaG/YvyC family protein
VGNLLEPLTNTMSKHPKAVIPESVPVEINIKTNPCKEEEKAVLPAEKTHLIGKRVGELKQKTRTLNDIQFQFVINGPTGQDVLKIIDRSTGRLILEIRVDILNNLSRLEEPRGVISDQKI